MVFHKCGDVCAECEAQSKLDVVNSRKRKVYEEAMCTMPLKRVMGETNLSSRVNNMLSAKNAKIKELKEHVSQLLSDKESLVEVDEGLSEGLCQIMAKGEDEEKVDSFHSLFWKEQERLRKVSANGSRYHPETVRFCLSLAAKSSSAYNELRDSGILRLPSTRTLCDYRNVFQTSPGVQQPVLGQIKKQVADMSHSEKFIVLSMDEMKVKENLVYAASTDSIVGFLDLGDTRMGTGEKLATHALQFYARSIAGRFSRPLAFFSTASTKAEVLASMFWEMVAALKTCGLAVVAFVADGAPTNRKMFKLLNNMKLEIPYKCVNIFDPPSPIFLIPDPPHLLKTTCNNVKSSRPNGPRMLKYGKHFILWSHFRKVPTLFNSTELKSCKLTDRHFSLKSYAKMRVVYAAQLLSGSVERMMKKRGGDSMQRSAWLAGLMNEWFDVMNTSWGFGYNKKMKPFTENNDERLTWLTETFLTELENWKKSTTGSPGEKAKQFLSVQTYEGLVAATKAIKELVPFLLDVCEPGTYILTRRINQDPLEAYFGHMRQIGRRNEAPDIHQYSQFENTIVTKKLIKSVKGSNVRCQPDFKAGSISNEKLPKRCSPREKPSK